MERAGFWFSALLFVCFAALLRVAGRGSLERLARPRRSRRVLYAWPVVSISMFVVCRWAGLFHDTPSAGHATELTRLVGPRAGAAISALAELSVSVA